MQLNESESNNSKGKAGPVEARKTQPLDPTDHHSQGFLVHLLDATHTVPIVI